MKRFAPRIAAFCAVAGLALAAQGQQPADMRRSGFDDMGPALQAIQRDDMANPAMLWLVQGEGLWSTPTGKAAKSCADCHGTGETMRGVAARYPAFDAKIGAIADLDRRIEHCRTEYQQAPSPARESRDRLALELFVARQSRGLPIVPATGAELDAAADIGAALYRQRQGQINLSCAQCHDERAGEKLAGVTIPQAHPTGYPIYRSEWQGVGSLQRRLRNCMIGTRAEPYAYGAPEMLAIEVHLMRRASGMRLETPAVRP